jgi:uncharacterized protein (TIGR03435 family)
MTKLAISVPIFAAALGMAQSNTPATASSEKRLEFEVASVKPNRSGDRATASNTPLGPGSVYTPTGGLFSAQNFPLAIYINFAYKVTSDQTLDLRKQLPDWAIAERYDIEARAQGNPTKDEVRLMMRSLLEDRFGFKVRYETREIPVFGLTLAKPGKTGPTLRLHDADAPACPADQSGAEGPVQLVEGGFPSLCGGIFPLPASAPGPVKLGARNVPMAFIARELSGMSQMSRHVVDQTGLNGNYDFTLEWTPQRNGPSTGASDNDDALPGATFLQALHDQLGLKLVAQTGPATVMIVDHLEHFRGEN